jgi:hypothetical protein
MVERILDSDEGFPVKYACDFFRGCFVFGIFRGECLESGSFARTTLDRVLREVCRRGQGFFRYYCIIVTALM